MIKSIIKQMWNKRRSHGWIFFELVLVTFFLWSAIDPLYVILSNMAIDEGYDTENVFRIKLGEYESTHSRYNAEYDTDSLRKISFWNIYREVENYPGVESAVATNNNGYPYSGSYMGNKGIKDTISGQVQVISFFPDGDYFKVFRIKDINGNYPDQRVPEKDIFITANTASRFFPGGNALGNTMFVGDSTKEYRVVGVIDKFKYRSTTQPEPTVFMPHPTKENYRTPYGVQIAFRMKENESRGAFIEKFREEMTPRFRAGNYYFLDITGFDAIKASYEFTAGITNRVRLQFFMALFFLICVFIGIAGSFWLKTDARRSEIGLRMSLGSSRISIRRQFLTEAWILVTASYILGIIFVLQKVWFTGFAHPTRNPDPGYLQNQPVVHFLIVSLIVYILILIIALAATWIPASRASGISPAESLRDE